MTNKLFLLTFVLASVFAASANADDGHDHGGAPAAPTGPALPRFSAASDLFEVVGVVNGKQLTIYLDRFADNSPVKGATVELEMGGAKVALKEHEPGEFEATLADAPKPGITAVTATVVAGAESDILAGEFDIHEEAHAEVVAAPAWRKYAPWAAGGLALLAVAAFFMRRAAASRNAGFGGAA